MSVQNTPGGFFDHEYDERWPEPLHAVDERRTTSAPPQRFRKRPVVIQAVRAAEREVIHTLEGDMTTNPGDWIVTGVKGERYPVKPEIFDATYEPADDDGGQFGREIERAINLHSRENGSNTPDFILAAFLVRCLSAWDEAIRRREEWYGRAFMPGALFGGKDTIATRRERDALREALEGVRSNLVELLCLGRGEDIETLHSFVVAALAKAETP